MTPLTSAQEETTVFGNYDDPSSEEYGWKTYFANGGERTGYNPGPAPDSTSNVLWASSQISGLTGIRSGMIAMDGKLICASSSSIFILNPNTGAILNTISISSSIGSTFSFNLLFQAGDTEFFTLGGGFGGGGLRMYNTEGALLWTDSSIAPSAVYHPALMVTEDGYTMLCGPVSYSSSVVSGMFPNNVNSYVEVAWDLSNPSENKGAGQRFKWAHLMDNNGGNPQLCYGDGKIYMGEYSGWGVTALDADTGDLAWETSLKDAQGYAAVYGDGKLFTHCQSVWVTALNTTDGSILWSVPDGLDNRGYAVWHGIYAYDRVYWHDLGEGLTGETKCFDAETGEKLWGSLTISNIGYYQFCCADGKIFGQQSDGSTTTGRPATPTSFACWDAFTGETLWTLGISCTAPVVAYGNLYIVANNAMTCYGPADAPAPGTPASPAEPVDWPMWRGSVENPGVAAPQVAPIMLNLGPIWTYEMEAGTSSSPAIVDGKVYIGSADCHLYCLDVNDGHQIWNATLERRVYSSPAVANGRVYTGSDDGKFHCFDAETGEELFTVNDGSGAYVPYNTGLGQMQIRSSPIIYNNRIYVGGSSGNFYCFNLDLTEIWHYNTGRFIGGSAAIEDDYVYVFSTNNNLYKFDLNGNLQFSRAVTTSYASGMFVMPADWAVTPVVVDDVVYVGVNTQYLVAVSATDGAPYFATKQPFDTSESSHSSLTYYNGRVYAPAGPLTVGASGTDGTNIWSAWGSWEIFCSTIVVPNTTPSDPLDAIIDEPVVYIGSEAGSMTCISTTDGTALSWFTTGGNLQSTAAMYGGKLIFGSADNLVYCFQDPDFSHHVTSAVSVEVDQSTANIDASEDFTFSAKLTPGLPDMELVASVIEPDGETTHTISGTSDIKGKVAFTYTPEIEGIWSIVVQWDGAENVRGVAYPAAYSQVVPLTALATPETLVTSATADKNEMNPGDTATLTATATGGTGEYNYQWFQTINGVGVEMSGKTSATLTVTLSEPNVYGYYCQVTDSAVNPQVHSSDTVQITVLGAGGTDMGLIYAVVGIIAVAVIAIVAYLFLKKRK